MAARVGQSSCSKLNRAKPKAKWSRLKGGGRVGGESGEGGFLRSCSLEKAPTTRKKGAVLVITTNFTTIDQKPRPKSYEKIRKVTKISYRLDTLLI